MPRCGRGSEHDGLADARLGSAVSLDALLGNAAPSPCPAAVALADRRGRAGRVAGADQALVGTENDADMNGSRRPT